ncbi:MAG TPA: choice-of-anchor Q domain-containing protein, partial [Thermoanaerobaculia bacterium]|nr:choice-of-anchor Q domain-containing protein [Thermoanaerobaculia bacterium]
GGGIAAGGSVQIHDATLSGNHSGAAGGGLYVQPGASGGLTSLTVTANESAAQGGGAQLDAALPWTSSVVAGNGAPLHSDAAGVVASAGFNLWGVAEGVTLAAGDQGGSAAHPLDPKLAPLAEQGGPTPTHAPLPGSPALEAGGPADEPFCAAFDQRGVRRNAAATGRCDAGAVEVTPSCVPGNDRLCLAGGRFEVTARWQSGELAGAATAVPITDESGSFWFFAASNLELTVKVVDACGAGANGRFWVFSSGLTDTAVTLTVRDTATGHLRTYRSNAGSVFPTRLDTDAFLCS